MAYLGREAAKAPIVTADLPNDGVTLAKMTGGTYGNIISYDASGDPVAIATGTDGQVLTSTGAGSPPAFEGFPAGHVLQVKSAVVTAYSLITTHLPSDDTIPQNDEGGEVITQAITAGATDNTFWIFANIYAGTAANDTCTVALFKDSDAGAIAATAILDSGHMTRTLVHKITTGSISQITFKIRAGCTWADTYVNGGTTARLYGGVAATTLTIYEVKGAI